MLIYSFVILCILCVRHIVEIVNQDEFGLTELLVVGIDILAIVFMSLYL